MVGTIVNVVTVILGGLLGILLKKALRAKLWKTL